MLLTPFFLSQIIFYEEKNLQGRSYECMSDCADVSAYLSKCQSCRVESGCFMIYERPNFLGNQHFMKKGEHADSMSVMGMSSGIKSCRLIPMVGIKWVEGFIRVLSYSFLLVQGWVNYGFTLSSALG